VDFEGQYYQAKDSIIAPRGPRPQGPPLLIGSFGERMLRLTARYADLWNTAYLGKPGTLDKPHEDFLNAGEAVGRDPATLGITVLVALYYPDLLPEKPSFDNEPLSGTAEEIAAAMQEYENKGVVHLVFHLAPYTSEALNRLSEALHIYRKTA